jgi:hypothetical protein
LRKKISEHKNSKAHVEAVNVLQIRGAETLETKIVDQQQHAWLASSNIFRTAYYLAKHKRPFTDHCSLVDLQRLNGVNVGRVLHSRTTCVDIIDHISDKMRKDLTQSIVDSGVPFAVLIDESTTISNKTCLVVYIRCSVGDSTPISLFLDLIELSGTTAESITKASIDCLHTHHFNDDILRTIWCALGTDGASVMLGRKGGVKTRLK